MNRADASRPPDRVHKNYQMDECERRWNAAIAKLLSYVPFDIVKEVRDLGEQLAEAKLKEILSVNGSKGLFAEVERRLILRTYHESGTVNAAAKRLGLGKNTLYRKLKDYGVL